MGIPADAAAKDDTLTVHLSAGSRSCIFVQPFAIAERSFAFERIRMSRTVSALIEVPDKRKAVEYWALMKILRSCDPGAIYETGPLAIPLPGARRTAGYGDRRESVLTDSTSETSIHQGIDLAAPTGTPVAASGRGRVVFSGLRLLTGNTVVIEHLPGLYSVYFHLSASAAALDAIVEKGQVIGSVGMTGVATGPHLHWETEALGVAVDPDALTAGPLLDKEPVF
jgi:murein DD-endopeptidase MepM/ murein hydrolase activator NlpD